LLASARLLEMDKKEKKYRYYEAIRNLIRKEKVKSEER